MATFNKFYSFGKALGDKIHNLNTDQLMVALCASANAPVATNAVLADLTQISYTNLSTRNITTTSWTQSLGTAKLLLVNLVLTTSGTVATFRYVAIYNNTATNKELIGWVDYGTDISLFVNNTVTINFDAVSQITLV